MTPLTNRGVENPRKHVFRATECKIDWLQYSVPWPADLRCWPNDFNTMHALINNLFPKHESLHPTGEMIGGIRGYDHGMALTYGRVFWHSKIRAQHMGVIFSGDDLSRATNAGLPPTQLLAYARSKAKTIPRLDFALDVFDPRAKPLDIMELWQAGKIKTHSQVAQQNVTYQKDGNGGQSVAPTVYIGTRQSERMLRIYDKAKQMGIAGEWTRIELQTRGDAALALSKNIQVYGLANGGCASVRSFVNAPSCDWFSDATAGDAVVLHKIVRKESDTMAWLINQAIPIMERVTIEAISNGDRKLYNSILGMVDRIRAFDDGRHIGLR